MKALYISFLLLLTVVSFAQQPGTLDKTFGRKGRQWDTVGRYAGYPAMLVQPDGKIIVGGSGFLKGSGIKTFRIDRLQKNGTPDNTFGVNGTVLVAFHLSANEQNLQSAVTALALRPDGRILAAGVHGTGSSDIGDLTVMRFMPDGSIDASFGDSGIAQPKAKNGYSKAAAMQLQADNKIVLGGNFIRRVGAEQFYFLERLLPNGSLDATFATGGQIYDSLGNVNALVIQPDGKVVAGGENGDTYGKTRFLIRRYLTNGKPDISFGKNGTVDTLIGSILSYITDLALQPDGKIVAVGGSGNANGTYPYFTLTRFLANGAIDKAFGSNGAVISSNISYSPKVLLYSNKILLAGNRLDGNPDNSPDVVVNAYNTNGSTDSSFANKGTLIANYDVNDLIGSAALQPDGKIILLDLSRDYEQTYEVRNLLRYYGYPAPPSLLAEDKEASLPKTAIPALQVSPNPASNYILINGLPAGAKTTIMITDNLGKTAAVYNTNNAAQYRADVSKLTAGIYYVQIIAAGKTETRRFVKE